MILMRDFVRIRNLLVFQSKPQTMCGASNVESTCADPFPYTEHTGTSLCAVYS